MRKIVLILFIFSCATFSGFAQLKTYTFSEAAKLEQSHSKPIFVFVHTSWCKNCRMMENSTFKNPEVIRLLNENYYFVALDAESTTPIRFNNYTFRYQPKGQHYGIHELAEVLATIDGTVTYPTFSILDKNNAILLQINSYTDAPTMIRFLKEVANFH